MSRIILYDYHRSSAAYRIRIGLNLKGVEYEQRPVNLLEGEQRSGDYRALNPQGLVPMLDIDGHRFTQSMAILGYLALNAVAARLLGPAGFASFVVLLTLTTLVGQLGLLGVHRSGVREAARAEHPDEVAELLHGVKAVLGLPLPLASLGCSLGVWAWQGFDATAAPVAADPKARAFSSIAVWEGPSIDQL